ncbi:hypothetical protein MA13_contig00013-0057 [Edwardsiella piscicida]|nr:hypothetical protein MA13_contig00013-0057 [Edwardsiella piscicida]
MICERLARRATVAEDPQILLHPLADAGARFLYRSLDGDILVGLLRLAMRISESAVTLDNLVKDDQIRLFELPPGMRINAL